MRILVINGPNLNMLGIREKNLYGEKTYKALVSLIKNHAKVKGVKVKFFQSNSEGALVTAIQKVYQKFDGIVINPGAYTHTSVALLDAIKSVDIPTVEVHITAVNEREDFRKISYIRSACFKVITGQGFDGYLQAIDAILKQQKQ